MHQLHRHLREYLLLALIAIGLLMVAKFGGEINFEKTTGFLRSMGVLGAVFYVGYSIISTVIITLPVVPLWPVALYIYDYWLAVFLSVLGIVLGASINFWLARRFGRRLVIRMLGRNLFEEIEHLINIADPKTFFLVRIFGNNYFDPLSYLAGLSKISFRTFMVITIVTASLWIMGVVYIIDLVGGLENMTSFLTIMTVYGAFILIGTIIWEIFHRRHRKHFASLSRKK